MIIREIKFNDKTMVFELLMGNYKKLKVSYETFEKLGLSLESDVNDEQYEELRREDEYIYAKEMSIHFINYRMRSTQEIKDKLKENNIPSDISEETMKYLEEKGYIDDQLFAEEFTAHSLNFKNKSLLFTRRKLYEKGLDKNLIDDIEEKFFSEEKEAANARIWALRKTKAEALTDTKEFNKTFRYLATKGFDYDISRRVLNEIKDEQES